MKRSDISIGVAAVLVVASIVWLMDERKRRNQAQLSTHVTPTPTLSADTLRRSCAERNAKRPLPRDERSTMAYLIYWKK